MTIMQQMNLFNTSSEVAGFKLDYLEVWNWGTFDKKVYHMNLHGNFLHLAHYDHFLGRCHRRVRRLRQEP